MDNIQTIGKVKLNLKYYSGVDLYSDGDIEDELLDIVMNNDESNFNQIIWDRHDWALMYHLSHIRQNIVGTVAIDKNTRVLEIGAGCGAVTGALADRAKSVTCIELSKKRSTINAYRNKNRDNIEILVGNFQDIEKELGEYDCITLIGVFEYADAYIDAEDPYTEFLGIIKKHLTSGGKIVMAIENKMGLKYFAGCKEDHFGEYFEGIENYTNTNGVKTFTRRELEKMFKENDIDDYKFYYPYPDYKFPLIVFSDEYLPKTGELNNNVQNFDRDRMLLFDETKAFDNIINEGLFPLYSNSYLVEIGANDNRVVYKKYSNDRDTSFSISTEMIKENDTLKIRKSNILGVDSDHIEGIIKWSEKLKQQYAGTGISICESRKNGHVAESDYITGKPLDEIADEYIISGELEKAEKIIREVIQIIMNKNLCVAFEKTDEFIKVFGDVSFEGEMHSAPISDIDMILGNIIECDGEWKLIDYEWTFDFPVPAEFIVYRMLNYYFNTNNRRWVIKDRDYISLTEADRNTFDEMETNFQNYVKGDLHPLREMYRVIGKPAVNIQSILRKMEATVKIYKDRGTGYSEEDVTHCSITCSENGIYSLRIKVEEGVLRYRIDPCEMACVMKIEHLLGNAGKCLPFTTNGVRIDGDVYVYENDPWVEVEIQDTIIEDIQLEFYLETRLDEYDSLLAAKLKLLKETKDLPGVVDELRKQLAESNAKVDALSRENTLMMASRSWKMTKPLRVSKKVIKDVLKSNKITYKLCRKLKSIIRGVPIPDPVEIPTEVKEPTVEEIVNTLCPRDEWEEQRKTEFPLDIKFSILVPLYNTPERFLREMIESVQYQSYQNWELCLADGSDDQHSYVEEICHKYADSDDRIVYKRLEENLGISGNTNACIDMATGNYIALFDHDDFLHPSVLYENMKAICEHGADYIYTDEATFAGTDIFHIITKHCKPDYAIDNLRANNYICHFSVFKTELLEKAGRFRSEYDGSQDHDLILRLTDKAEKVFHIRKILYYWRSHPGSVAEDINAKSYAIDAAKRAVESHLNGAGLKAEVSSSKAFPTIFRIQYELKDTPKISILIPNKDHKEDLKRCVESILHKSTYPNYEIIIVENNSIMKETFEYYKELEQNEKIMVVQYNDDFNYSKINNYGVKFATGDYILLLNNDTEVITDRWMEELMMYGQRDDVAAVGAKLYYGDDTIQHAGIIIGLGADRTAGHAHYGVDRENVGYMGRLYYAQDVSAVTGACLLIKKSIYNELGGMDENFTVAFNDVDLCLKAREKGYLNVFTPYCELYHYESKSRGLEDSIEKKKRFHKEVEMFRHKWTKVLTDGDPYYNPNFSLDRSDFYIPD